MLGRICDKGTYHLVQAPHLVTASDEAVKFYRGWGQSTRHFLILDNGAYELGGEADIQATIEAAKMVHPDEIVCPDTIKNATQTVNLCCSLALRLTRYAPSIMIIPQGRDGVEWLACLNIMHGIVEEMGIPYSIGIPKYLELEEGGRLRALEHTFRYTTADHIHLLGTQSSIYEFRNLAMAYPALRGADTTLPFAAAQHGAVMAADLRADLDRKYDVKDWNVQGDDSELIKLTSSNIKVCRAIVNESGMRLLSLQGENDGDGIRGSTGEVQGGPHW
jgi:hypothetical protein